MGLRRALTRLAASRVHALVVEPPGCFAVRVAAERAAARRGWVVTDHPGDADLLVLLGSPSAELRSAADRLYEAMPGPRARVEAPSERSVDRALAEAVRLLEDEAEQQSDARERDGRPGDLGGGGHDDMGHGGHGDMDHDDMGHNDMGHRDMGHRDMGHGHMTMALGGIVLAGRGKDRDGLEMDRLHLPLGPVLRFWPAGLVLTCVLHGDVVMEAEAEWVGRPSADGETSDHWLRAASWLDAAAAVLVLGGSSARAAAVRAVRDACLDREPSASNLVTRQRHTIARSPVLRWSLRSLAGVDSLTGEPSPAFTGDAFVRLLDTFDAASAELAGREALTPDPSVLVARLPTLVAGRELGEVRLLVAGLAPAFGPAAERWGGEHDVSEAPR